MIKSRSKNAFLVLALSLLGFLPASLFAADITRDPMKDYVKIVERYKNKPYFLRAYVYPGEYSIQVYIKHSHRGDHRYRNASVRWIDGMLKSPKLHDIDTDIDCSGYSSSCRRTEHMMIKVSSSSWMALDSWARNNPEASLPFQIQANQEGEDFDFSLDAAHIISFQDELKVIKEELN